MKIAQLQDHFCGGLEFLHFNTVMHWYNGGQNGKLSHHMLYGSEYYLTRSIYRPTVMSTIKTGESICVILDLIHCKHYLIATMAYYG